MYRYIIGEDCYDSYSEIEILHHEVYTKDQFINICKQALSKLDYKDRKTICDSYGDSGTYLIGDMLVKHFGFIQPDKVKSHIHLLDLLNFGDYDNCVDCPKSYELNGKIHCTYDECGKREILKEEFE